MMRVLSLFSGIGGIDLGLERAGMQVVAQCEIEPFARAVLAKHWPNVRRYEDVRQVRGEDVWETCGPINVVAGGFPCQDISTAGKGAGIERGARSGLWREMRRIIEECRPRWVLAENVPALRTRGADVVLADLEALGYACWPVVVGAWAVGAPHRRDRVWIVGRLADAEGAVQPAFAGSTRSGQAEGETEVQGGRVREGLWMPVNERFADSGDADVADATCGGHDEGRDLPVRQGGQDESPRNPSRSSVVADAERERCGARSGHVGDEEVEGSGRAESLGGDSGLADAPSVRCEGLRTLKGCEGASEKGWGVSELAGRGSRLADADAQRRRQRHAAAESTDVGLPGGRGHAWPARPGEPQHGWEEPRIVGFGTAGLDDPKGGRVAWRGEPNDDGATDREFDSPLDAGVSNLADSESVGRPREGQRRRSKVAGAATVNDDEGQGAQCKVGGATDGLPAGLVRLAKRHNRESLRAYGNAVVPQVVEAIGRWIVKQESA